jgi:hypothetical protein
MAWNDPIDEATDWSHVDFLNQFVAACQERAALYNAQDPALTLARIASISPGDDVTQCDLGAAPFPTSWLSSPAPSAAAMRRIVHLQKMADWLANWQWCTAAQATAMETLVWTSQQFLVMTRADVYAQAGLPRPFSASTVPFTRRFPKELSSLTPVAESFIEPVADTNTAWSPTGAATRWDAVNEGASPNLSDYLAASTSSEQQLRHGASGSGANRLVLRVYAASTSGTPTLSGRLQTAQGWTSTQALASGAFAAGWYTATWDGGWTQTDLAALLSGLSLSGSGGARIYTVRVQVLPQYDGEAGRSLGDGQTYQYDATGNTWQLCDPQVPPTTLSAQGLLQPGDYIGPWIFTELRALLNAMLIRMITYQVDADEYYGQPTSGTTLAELCDSAVANAVLRQHARACGSYWYVQGSMYVSWTTNAQVGTYVALPGMAGMTCKLIAAGTISGQFYDQGWGWTQKVNRLHATFTIGGNDIGSTAFNLPYQVPNYPTSTNVIRGITFQFVMLADGRTKFAYQP